MTLRDDFRGPLPLDADDFAAIRARVMSTIARRQRPRFPFALRFSMAAAVLAIIGLAVYLTTTRPTAPPATRRPPTAAVPAPAHPAANSNPAPLPISAQAAVQRPAGHASPHREALQSAASTASAIVRMEIHTADPDVRIIWIAASRLEEQ